MVNSTQIDRQLSLALQIRSLGLPAIILLNMQDESNRAGITIDTEAMSQQIHMPVIKISAKYGDGYPTLMHKAGEILADAKQRVDVNEVAKRLEADNQIEEEMHAIVNSTVQIPTTLNNDTTDSIDKVLLHPWLGLPIFILATFLLFQFIFTAGAHSRTAWHGCLTKYAPHG